MKKYLCILTLTGALVLGSGVVTTAGAQATQTHKKWSKKAKYATIGGVVGAGTGVAVSKKNKKGAAVGAVVGAGTGYLYGRHKDRKSAAKRD